MNMDRLREVQKWVAIATFGLLAPLAIGLTPASASVKRSQTPAFTYSGTGCTETSITVQADPQRVRPFVPKPFEPVVGRLGKTSLIVAQASCEAMSVDGDRPQPGMLSEVGVRIQSPDGSEGAHYYEIWQIDSIPKLRSRFARMGMLGGLVRDMVLEQGATGPIATVEGSVPWEDSPYSSSALFVTPPATPSAAHNSWWHLGSDGPFRIAYTFTDVVVHNGAGVLEAAPGTPLAEMTGAETTYTTAALFYLNFSATVEPAEIGGE